MARAGLRISMPTIHDSCQVNATKWPIEVDDPVAQYGPALAEALAHVEARPFYIGPDNVRTGAASSVAEASTSGRSYALRLADDVIALDLDDPATIDAADALAERIKAAGWPVLRTTSGRVGHRHLWAVIPSAVERTIITDDIEALGLPRPRPVMRPPLSPHRLDLPVTTLDDVPLFLAAVEAVRSSVGHGPAWQAILRTGRHSGRDQSGSATVWRVCIGAARDGLTLDDLRPLLADPLNLGGAGYRRRIATRGLDAADRWLGRHVWPSAVERAAHLPPADADEARERLTAIANAIEVERWAGMAGATDRAVMAALIARGVARGSMTPVMSYREIAEAAPCGLRTVQRAVTRLIASGWLQVARKGRGTTEVADDGTRIEVAMATRWRITAPHRARLDHTGGTPPASTSLSVVTTRAHPETLADICRWRGLGLNAPRVLTTLTAGSMTTDEIAAALNLSIGNLRARLLPKIAAHGLIERTDGRWHLTDDLDAAARSAAVSLNLAGRTAEVAARHQAERTAFLDHRERTRPNRDARRRTNIADDLDHRRTISPPADDFVTFLTHPEALRLDLDTTTARPTTHATTSIPRPSMAPTDGDDADVGLAAHPNIVAR